MLPSISVQSFAAVFYNVSLIVSTLEKNLTLLTELCFRESSGQLDTLVYLTNMD